MKQLSNGNLLTCSMDNSFKVWNLKNEKLVFTVNETLDGHLDWVTDFVQLEAGNASLLATSSFDKTIKVWKIEYDD